MPYKVLVPLALLALLAGLTFPATFPEAANIPTFVLMGVGLIVLLTDRGSRPVLRQPAVWLPLLAGLILAFALLFTASSPLHVVAVFILAPLFLVGPLAALLRQLRSKFTPVTIGTFALAGASGAVVIAIYDVVVRGRSRGGTLFNNVIHFADLALAIGFIAAVGMLGSNRRLRPIFILSPVLAIIAVLLANSRGPLLAVVPVAVVGVAVLSAYLLPRRWIAPAAVLTLVLILGGGAVAYALGLADRLSRLGNVVTVFATGATTDNAVGERFYMLISAWNAFWASPIFGHGLLDYTRSAAQYAPPGPMQFKPSQHLHNDIADFAVIGGSLGLVSYALLMAAPLIGALRVRGQWRGAAIYLGAIMPVGYLAMGLTNAMLGILTQTVVYAVGLAIIAAFDDLDDAPSSRESVPA